MYHGHPAADVNLLVDPDYLDPISGFPGFKALLCSVRKLESPRRRKKGPGDVAPERGTRRADR